MERQADDGTQRQAAAQALREAEARFRETFEHAPIGMAIVALDGRVVQINPALARLIGRPAEELVGEQLGAFAHPDEQPGTAWAVQRLLAGEGRAHEADRRYWHVDGRWRWGSAVITLVRDEDGSPLHLIVQIRDITERREAEERLRRSVDALRLSEAGFRSIFEQAPIGMAVVGPDGRWLRVNPALCAIVGYPEEELLAKTFQDITHPEDLDTDLGKVERVLSGAIEDYELEKRYLHADGHVVWVSLSVSLVRGTDGEPLHFIAQMQDITDRKHFEGQLQHRADHDALTGLFNRRRIEIELERTVAHVKRYQAPAALLVLDVDKFKHVNDSYGHAVGDELIGAVASTLRRRLRETDILGRMGGDEFAILLTQADAIEARLVAADLVWAVRTEVAVSVSGQRQGVTASVGTALIPSDSRMTAAELLAEADVAMYEAKESGRDRVAVAQAGARPAGGIRERLTCAELIRDALDHDGFELASQPILGLASGRVERHELLIRMSREDGEPLPPGAFLSVAERFGQIQAIDRWVIGEAVRILAQRREAGERLVFEVNISGGSITDPEVVDHIAEQVSRAAIDPAQLVLEVTETSAIGSIEQARRFAKRLAALGCQFALDDFGAGFGSFYYLKHLPFDVLKIDGDFVRDLPRSVPDQLTVKAIVEIARGLGKQTIAEYVQDDATLRLLRDFGVDYAQGFHVGRPVPADDCWPATARALSA